MTEPTLPSTIHLGFLTVFAEGTGTLGGYLVTNTWGRPLEFRLSTAVQPNRIQTILYGSSLQEYLRVDLVGKSLIEKSATQPHLIVSDTPELLPLRSRLSVPVIAVSSGEGLRIATAERASLTMSHERAGSSIQYSLDHADDEEWIRAILDRVDASLDLTEPFARIREAMTEARKMGATSRAA